MGLDKVIGQKNSVILLKKSLQNNKISHCYIFSGPDGTGKKTTAKAFVQSLFCKDNNDSCDICNSCMKIKKNIHPDVKIIEPDGKSIKIKQIRDINKDIWVKPYESYRKVYIITEGEKLTTEASNALLKTLENPPDYAVIIITTRNHKDILPTIRSRSQILPFNPLQNKEIEKYIDETGKYQGIKDKKVLIALANGSIKKALDYLEDEEFRNTRNEVIEALTELKNSQNIDFLKYSKLLKDKKEKIYEVLDIALIWFRDIVVLKTSNKEKIIINVDRLNELEKEGYILPLKNSLEIIEIINETKLNLQGNSNYDLTVEGMFLKLLGVYNKLCSK